MRLRTFLQLTTVFVLGLLLTMLIWALHLPRWLGEFLSFVVGTLTIGTMWILRAKSDTLSNKEAIVSSEPPSKASDDRTR